MKEVLIQQNVELYYYKDGEKILGRNPEMTGDCSGLFSDCTGLTGNCTGLRGYCTRLTGHLNKANITEDEREIGINIKDLILK